MKSFTLRIPEELHVYAKHSAEAFQPMPVSMNDWFTYILRQHKLAGFAQKPTKQRASK